MQLFLTWTSSMFLHLLAEGGVWNPDFCHSMDDDWSLQLLTTPNNRLACILTATHSCKIGSQAHYNLGRTTGWGTEIVSSYRPQGWASLLILSGVARKMQAVTICRLIHYYKCGGGNTGQHSIALIQDYMQLTLISVVYSLFSRTLL